MRTQTYFHTRMERDADIRNEAVPLQVNCCGVVADQVFNSQRVRRDFYLMYALKGEIVTKNFTLFPGKSQSQDKESSMSILFQRENCAILSWKTKKGCVECIRKSFILL